MYKKLFIILLFVLSGCNSKKQENKVITDNIIQTFYDNPNHYQDYEYHFLGNIVGDVEYNEQGYSIFTVKDEYELTNKDMIVYYNGKIDDLTKGCKVEITGIIEGLIQDDIEYNQLSCNEIKLIEKPVTHFDINQSKTVHNITFHIISLDYENGKSKLSVRIEKHSGVRYNFYDYLTYIDSDRRYDAIYNYNEEDLILDSIVENNTTKEGFIIFREIEKGKMNIHIGGWSGSPTLGEISCDFEVKI